MLFTTSGSARPTSETVSGSSADRGYQLPGYRHRPLYAQRRPPTWRHCWAISWSTFFVLRLRQRFIDRQRQALAIFSDPVGGRLPSGFIEQLSGFGLIEGQLVAQIDIPLPPCWR